MRYRLLLVLAVAMPLWAQPAITHGPILGRVSSTGIGVWVRTTEPAVFRVRYGATPAALDKRSPAGRTRLGNDNTGWVHLSGLEPGTKYYYQVVVEGTRPAGAPHGSFRTLPAAEHYRNAAHNPRGLFNFKFEYACGNNQSRHPATPVFATMLRELKDKIQFAILNGDWLYEDSRDYPVSAWLQQVHRGQEQMPRVVGLAPSITGLWQNYKVYLSRSFNLAAWHRNMPSFFTFDDHEILNDVYGMGTAGRRDKKALLRDIAVKAWYDYLGWSNPVPPTQPIQFGEATLEAGSDILTDPEADFTRLKLSESANLHIHWGGQQAGDPRSREPGNPNAGIYDITAVLGAQRLRISPAARATGTAAYSIGRISYFDKKVANAHFFFLDTRTFRQMHDSNHPDKPGLSMLGARQKQWLLDGMKRSDADFFFVISSVNFMIPHVGGTPAAEGPVRRISNKDDAWTVFLDEREQLIRAWDRLGKPVMVLTGDLHNSFAIRITGNVWEFASAPHNSRNHVAASEANRPPNGIYDSHGRKGEIRWSTYFLNDTPGTLARQTVYTVVQINNVFNSPTREQAKRWVAYPKPQVIFRFHDGATGNLLYAESIVAR